MKKRAITIALTAALLVQAAPAAFAYDSTTSTEYRIFEQISEIAAQYYIDETLTGENIMEIGLSEFLEDNPELLNELLKKTFTGLDPYCEYFTADEYAAFMRNLDKYTYGIGATLQKIGDYVTVMAFTDESYAPGVGVQVGDKIIAVDGQDVVGASLSSVSALLRSETTDPVTLTLLRGEETVTVSITRTIVQDNTVIYNFPNDNTAYIRITNMSTNTSDEFAEALAEVNSRGITNIILDLRGNPGGYVSAAVQIASQIVPEGKIVEELYRNEEYNATYYSELKNVNYNFNVLVNGNTASASELLAAAMQESGVGYLIGETTYGKALMQVTVPLNNGSAFKITTGRYLTRDGNDINEVGIVPDEAIANSWRAINTSDYGDLDYSTKWDVGMSGDAVIAAKNRLAILGYYSGIINDKYDEDVAEAVARFQEDQELFSYGVLDITTQVRLENIFAQINVTVDNQLKRAYEIFGVEIPEDF